MMNTFAEPYPRLHLAACFGNLDVVMEEVYIKKVDVNLTDDENTTALHVAASMGHLEIIKCFIDAGAEMSALNDKDFTPLHMAVAFEQIEAIELLLKYGEDVDIFNEKGETPLHIAVIFGKIKAADLLIKNGANVNALTQNGQTPLHYSAKQGYSNIAELLLSNESNFFEDSKALTPLCRANKKDPLTAQLIFKKTYSLVDCYDEDDYILFFKNLDASSFKASQIYYEAGLAMLTALYQSDQIRVRTTFIDEAAFSHYFFALKSAKRSLTERFVISGEHWRSGEIRIAENGKTDIVIFDSLPEFCQSGDLRKLFKIFYDVEVKIFTSVYEIQQDVTSCCIFSLDAWKRLDKVGNFLPKKYNGDLFKYLTDEENIEFYEDIKKSKITHYSCFFPLYFMKGMQSRKLINEIIPNKPIEANLPINKKGELPIKACRRTFVDFFDEDKSETYLRNYQIKRKKSKMRDNALQFIEKESIDKIVELSSQHTLSASIAHWKV